MNDFDLYPSLTLQHYDESLAKRLPGIMAHPRVTALRLELAAPPYPERTIKALASLLRTYDVALIIAPKETFKNDSLPLGDSDGLHFWDVSSLKAGITALKPLKLQTGCFCKTLDEAMYAGEAGTDYVSFPSEALDVIEKWSGFSELPCVAEEPSSPAAALESVKKGADFISFSLKDEASDRNWLHALTSE